MADLTIHSALDAIEAAINRDEKGAFALWAQSCDINAEDLILLLLALDLLDRHTSDELGEGGREQRQASRHDQHAFAAPDRAHQAAHDAGRWPMNAMSQIAETRASALSLRASAKTCGPERGALKFRLTRAAESLDAVVLIAVRGLDRIEELEQELRQLKAAGQGGVA